METKANHVLIGAFTLAAAAAALLFALWASSFSAARSWQEVDVVFTEAVTGLSVGSVVQYNGITVGSVRRLSLAPDDPRQVVARIRVDAEAPMRSDTTARLGFTGLTGVAIIQLAGGAPESSPLVSRQGEVPRIQAEESAIQKLLSAGEDIASTTSDVLLRIRDIMSEENAERVSQTLTSIEDFTSAIAGEREQISELIRSANQASQSLQEVLGRTSTVVERLDHTVAVINDELVDELPGMSEDLRLALTQFEALTRRADNLLADNEEALSSFGNQALGQVAPTLFELRVLIRDLARLTSRLESNPTRFLFGGDQPEEFDPR
ncbi:MAG: MlaD family protein [Lysobacteraceae bacterium]